MYDGEGGGEKGERHPPERHPSRGKEPYLRIPASGKGYAMRADHVSDVMFMDEYDSRVPAEWRKEVADLDPKEMKSKDSHGMKKKSYGMVKAHSPLAKLSPRDHLPTLHSCPEKHAPELAQTTKA